MSLYEYKGNHNLCGRNIRKLRKEQNMSQVELAAKMQIEGISIDGNLISRIEKDNRIVSDYELLVFAKVLGVSMMELLQIPEDEAE